MSRARRARRMPGQRPTRGWCNQAPSASSPCKIRSRKRLAPTATDRSFRAHPHAKGPATECGSKLCPKVARALPALRHRPANRAKASAPRTLIVTATLLRVHLLARRPHRGHGPRQLHRAVEGLPVLRQRRVSLAMVIVLWIRIVTATLPHAQLSARQPRRDCGSRQQHRVVEVFPVLRQQRAELARASVL